MSDERMQPNVNNRLEPQKAGPKNAEQLGQQVQQKQASPGAQSDRRVTQGQGRRPLFRR